MLSTAGCLSGNDRSDDETKRDYLAVRNDLADERDVPVVVERKGDRLAGGRYRKGDRLAGGRYRLPSNAAVYVDQGFEW